MRRLMQTLRKYPQAVGDGIHYLCLCFSSIYATFYDRKYIHKKSEDTSLFSGVILAWPLITEYLLKDPRYLTRNPQAANCLVMSLAWRSPAPFSPSSFHVFIPRPKMAVISLSLLANSSQVEAISSLPSDHLILSPGRPYGRSKPSDTPRRVAQRFSHCQFPLMNNCHGGLSRFDFVVFHSLVLSLP